MESEERQPIDLIADEIAERRRRGERPTLEEYVDRFPEIADRLRRVLPLLLLMEDAGSPERRAPQGIETRQLGDYRILRELGRGGMGVVYEAEQISLGRRVALKVLPQAALLDGKQLERFQTEARAAASLQHAAIVPVYEVGAHDGTHFFAMQLVEGQGLDRVIEELRDWRRNELADPRSTGSDSRLGDLALAFMNPAGFNESATRSRSSPTTSAATADRDASSSSSSPGANAPSNADPRTGFYRNVARLGARVADALHYAHERGILHRDIKPSNLLIDTTGQVWVADFGLAKSAGSDGLTATGDAVGTLRYMGPERFRGWSDPRSDVYSLGATLYELLALRPAFHDGDRAQLVQKILHEGPRPLHRIDARMPRTLETIVLKTLDRDPERRYSSALALADDLRRFVDDRPISARRATIAERTWLWCRRNRWVAGLGAAVILSLAIGIVVSTATYLRAEREKEMAEAHLKQARVDEARLLRGVKRVGQRVRGLEALLEAARYGVTDEIRDEAFNTLCLVDLRPIGKDFELGSKDRWNVDAAIEKFVHVRARENGRANVEVGDVSTREVLHSIPSPYSVTGHLGPSSKYVLLSQQDGAVELWNLSQASPRQVVRLQVAWVSGQFVRDDQGSLVVLAIDRQDPTRLPEYDAETGKLLRKLELPAPAYCFRPSPDRRWLAVAGYDHRVHIIERETGRSVGVAQFDNRVLSLAWHENGRQFAAGKADGEISVWDLDRSRVVRSLRGGHPRSVVRIAFQSGGNHLASSDFGSSGACLWNQESEQLVLKVSTMLAADFSPDGKRCATFTPDGNVRVCEVIDDGNLRVLSVDDNAQVLWEAFSPDGRYLAVGSDAGMYLYETVSGRQLARVEIGQTGCVTFHPDGSLISSGPVGIYVWPLDSSDGPDRPVIGPPRLIFETGPTGYFSDLSPDGTLLAVRKGGRVHIVSVTGGCSDANARVLSWPGA